MTALLVVLVVAALVGWVVATAVTVPVGLLVAGVIAITMLPVVARRVRNDEADEPGPTGPAGTTPGGPAAIDNGDDADEPTRATDGGAGPDRHSGPRDELDREH